VEVLEETQSTVGVLKGSALSGAIAATAVLLLSETSRQPPQATAQTMSKMRKKGDPSRCGSSYYRSSGAEFMVDTFKVPWA